MLFSYTYREQSIVSIRLDIRELQILCPNDMSQLTTSAQNICLNVDVACCSNCCIELPKVLHRASDAGVCVVARRMNGHITDSWLKAGIKNDLQDSFNDQVRTKPRAGINSYLKRTNLD